MKMAVILQQACHHATVADVIGFRKREISSRVRVDGHNREILGLGSVEGLLNVVARPSQRVGTPGGASGMWDQDNLTDQQTDSRRGGSAA
jgi:hypothetical protein